MLLCELVSKLEHKKLEGVVSSYPISSASALHNIRKALEELKSKKSIPLCYIYAEEEIHKGNHEVIVPLLKSIKYAYRNVSLYKYFNILNLNFRKIPQGTTNKSEIVKATGNSMLLSRRK